MVKICGLRKGEVLKMKPVVQMCHEKVTRIAEM